MNIEDYYKGCVKYEYDCQTGSFQHNLNKDLQLIIIWEGALYKKSEILAEINKNFKVIAECTIKWSEEHFVNNIRRFYKFFDEGRIDFNIELKVRGGEFYCVVVEDDNPSYKYRQNVSGPIQLVNTNVLKLKRKSRRLVGENIIHSSGDPEEFFEQAALLFTPSQLSEIISNSWGSDSKYLAQDLMGANGWSSFKELFGVVKLGSDYLVSRNFKYLPNDFFGNDKDVDIYCANYEDFVAIANVDNRTDKLRDYVTVSGEKVIFDVRSVEDNYIDSSWLSKVVKNKIYNNKGIFIPRDDDYFFTLIYHSFIQKPKIKEDYKPILLQLAKKLEFDFFDEKVFVDLEQQGHIINGYLKANKYKITIPKDSRVFINNEVTKYVEPANIDSNKLVYYELYKKYFPVFLKKIIPTNLKIMLKKIL